MKKLKKMLTIMEEKGFQYAIVGEQEVEFQTWTGEGVNMIFYTSIKEIREDILDYIDSFNVEEELLLHITDNYYMADIGIKKGILDFEEYEEKLAEIKEIILKK